MWKFIILAAAAYLLYRLFANDFLKKKKDDEIADKKEREQKIAAGEMVKDPETPSIISAPTNAGTSS